MGGAYTVTFFETGGLDPHPLLATTVTTAVPEATPEAGKELFHVTTPELEIEPAAAVRLHV